MNRLSSPELASVVSRRVKLTKRGDRWWGLCPFHRELAPSFYVWTGSRGEGRFHCAGCEADGDSIDWLTKIEKKSWNEAAGGVYKPDPELERARKREAQLKRLERKFFDIYPDASPEWSIIIRGMQ